LEKSSLLRGWPTPIFTIQVLLWSGEGGALIFYLPGASSMVDEDCSPTHPLSWLGSLVFRNFASFLGICWTGLELAFFFCHSVFLFSCFYLSSLHEIGWDLSQVCWSSDDEKRGATITTTRLKEERKYLIEPGKLHCTAILSSTQSALSEDNRTHVVGIPNTLHFRKTKPIYQQLQTMEALFSYWIFILILPILGEPLP